MSETRLLLRTASLLWLRKGCAECDVNASAAADRSTPLLLAARYRSVRAWTLHEYLIPLANALTQLRFLRVVNTSLRRCNVRDQLVTGSECIPVVSRSEKTNMKGQMHGFCASSVGARTVHALLLRGAKLSRDRRAAAFARLHRRLRLSRCGCVVRSRRSRSLDGAACSAGLAVACVRVRVLRCSTMGHSTALKARRLLPFVLCEASAKMRRVCTFLAALLCDSPFGRSSTSFLRSTRVLLLPRARPFTRRCRSAERRLGPPPPTAC
eukprot:3676105-Pleurochrysis_carterae.AAC.4